MCQVLAILLIVTITLRGSIIINPIEQIRKLRLQKSNKITQLDNRNYSWVEGCLTSQFRVSLPPLGRT